jgi:hypothetical protein
MIRLRSAMPAVDHGHRSAEVDGPDSSEAKKLSYLRKEGIKTDRIMAGMIMIENQALQGTIILIVSAIIMTVVSETMLTLNAG